MKAELITIGAELLQGRTLNSNAQYLSAELTRMNFDVTHHTVCDDDLAQIKASLNQALNRSRLIVITGGLGPTPDDITREAIAEYFQSDLTFHPAQYRLIQNFFKKINKKLSPITKKECFFPKIGKPILNQFGIALGFYIQIQNQLVVCLPGVPREMKGLFEYYVRRLIARIFNKQAKVFELNASLMGIDEAGAMRKFPKNFFKSGSFSFGSYPMDGRLVFRFRSIKKNSLSAVRKILEARFKPFIYAFSDIKIEETIALRALTKRKTLALAESCTGGEIAKRLTDSSGASKYFLGSVTAYSNQIKRDLLGVRSESLEKFGAVSKEVAIEMALGVRKYLKSDIAVSVTGIAGPSGGTLKKPVGLVCIAVADNKKVNAFEFRFLGDRDRIRRVAADKSLWLLFQQLRK